ncbi:MAG: hypothetical protein LBP98_01265 [Tannerella sp.]|nr:hypothetical protein [Tannerella sp.]
MKRRILTFPNGILRRFLRAGTLVAACALLFAACGKDDDDPEPEPEPDPGPVAWTLRYAVCVSENPENVPLPDLAGKTIQRIVLIEDEEAEWLNAAPAA